MNGIVWLCYCFGSLIILNVKYGIHLLNYILKNRNERTPDVKILSIIPYDMYRQETPSTLLLSKSHRENCLIFVHCF